MLHHTLVAYWFLAHIHWAVDSMLANLLFHGGGLFSFAPYVVASCHVAAFSHSAVVQELMSRHFHVLSVNTPLLKDARMPPTSPVLLALIVTAFISPGKVNLSVAYHSDFRLCSSPLSIIRLPWLSIVMSTSMLSTKWPKKESCVSVTYKQRIYNY